MGSGRDCLTCGIEISLSMVEAGELVIVCCGEIYISVGATCNYVQCVENLDPLLLAVLDKLGCKNSKMGG